VETNPLRTPFLYGEYELTIDDKNRLLVPAEIRRRLDPSEHGDKVPWFYPDRFYEQLTAAQVKPKLNPTPAELIQHHRNFSLVDRLEWDKQGRILIPGKYLSWGRKIGREVTLVAAFDHLELHNRTDWAAYREQLLAEPAPDEPAGTHAG
jgi:DNA-binding transcriptional regulator/RsmH inhibitor MraZ